MNYLISTTTTTTALLRQIENFQPKKETFMVTGKNLLKVMVQITQGQLNQSSATINSVLLGQGEKEQMFIMKEVCPEAVIMILITVNPQVRDLPNEGVSDLIVGHLIKAIGHLQEVNLN